MTRDEAVRLILAELDRAEGLYPAWPRDMVLAAAVVGEESGELLQAANNARWHGGDHERMREEAIQTAAMAVRFLVNDYEIFEKI